MTEVTRDVMPLICKGGIDVIVLDAYTPRTGIVELARAIEQLPDAPPIVLVSGSPDAPEISARIGAAAFLPKPCDTSDLVTAVTRLIGHARPVLVVADDAADSRPTTLE